MELCVLPGCETAAVTLPGGIGVSDAAIEYQYDALNRLTRASYSSGTIFEYTYDPAGNVLEYVSTIDGQSITTSYEYNNANEMVTAQASNTQVIWQYTYDGNGSLVQSSPGSSPADGAKRYTYNVAGFLTKAEAFAGDWQNQAEMTYDGLGRRLEMNGYADGQSVTTQYTYDNSQPLIASAADLETTYLYGLGPIAELTDSWSYSLPDGTNTPRQLTNANGEVTFAASYTPWGDTLAVSGTGNPSTGSGQAFTFGYFGGVMDAATGLLYVGNGQYYDPATGRFLTRNARPDQSNPYVPWRADASALLIAPLVLLSLIYSRKRGKRTRWDSLLVMVVIMASISLSVTACNPPPTIDIPGGKATLTEDPTNPKNIHVEITSTTIPNTITLTLTPMGTLTLPCPTPTQKTITPLGDSDHFQTSIVTLNDANLLFDTMAAQNDLAFGFPQDGCYARADLMIRRMQAMGVIASKIWNERGVTVASPYGYSGLYEGGSLKSVDTIKATDLQYTGEITWDYHVAPYIYVKQKDGSVTPMVIDPSLFGGPVSVDERLSVQKGSKTDCFTMSPGPASVFAADSLYFPNGSRQISVDKAESYSKEILAGYQKYEALILEAQKLRGTNK